MSADWSVPVTEQATEILPGDAYLSGEWYDTRRSVVTASEIAAICGVAPDNWSSPFDLWWNKRTGVDSQPENRDMSRGRRYEALVLDDFAEEHPELYLTRGVGLCVNNERPWQACTPDALAYEGERLAEWERELLAEQAGCDPSQFAHEPVAVVEAKTGARRDEWGESGTDAIPVHYRCQVLWQMDTLGLSVAYVPVYFGFSFEVFVVTYDEADIKVMREAAEEFLDSLAADRMPDIDAARATTRRLKLLHPSLVDDEAEVPATVVRQHQFAKRLRDCAEARMRLAENRLRAAMADSRTATVDGVKVASRSISDIPERTQHVKAHTRDVLYVSKPKKERNLRK